MNKLPSETPDNALVMIEPERALAQVVLPGGLHTQVRDLLEEWRHSEKLARFGLQPRNRVLLYGPSGNGKTTLAEAIASELKLRLGYVNYSQLVSSYVGQTGKNLGEVFDCVRSERMVLFFDEADSIASQRRGSSGDSGGARSGRNQSVNVLLMCLDQLPADTVVIFATNFVEELDVAMRRRINLNLEMPAPDLEDLHRLVGALKDRHRLLEVPLKEFSEQLAEQFELGEIENFATCEQLALDHCRRWILSTDDPLGIGENPRSHWLREQLKQQQALKLEGTSV